MCVDGEQVIVQAVNERLSLGELATSFFRSIEHHPRTVKLVMRYLTGNGSFRPGLVELFGLKWSAFDFQRGIVTVTQGKSGLLKHVVPPQAYLDEAHGRYESDRAKGVEFVCTRNGKQIFGYGKTWKEACKNAGVKMRPYDIRHLAATQMLANGADLAAVAAQLGHQNVATTGATYAHVNLIKFMQDGFVEAFANPVGLGMSCLGLRVFYAVYGTVGTVVWEVGAGNNPAPPARLNESKPQAQAWD